MSDVEETFPVHPSDRHLMESVPWDWIAKYQKQVEKNHGQTLQRLARRGGLSIEEIRCAIAGESLFLHTVEKSKSHAAICGAIASWRAMRDAFAKAKEATPKPDPSPVCVEVRKLEWERVEGASDDGDAWFAQFGDLLRYEIWQAREGFEWCMTANGEVDLCDVRYCPSLEAAQAACDADFTRRTLELVNARSVESVKAEALTEMRDDLTGVAACYGWSASQSPDGPYVSLADWITEQAAPSIYLYPNDFSDAIQADWDAEIRKRARAEFAEQITAALDNEALRTPPETPLRAVRDERATWIRELLRSLTEGEG